MVESPGSVFEVFPKDKRKNKAHTCQAKAHEQENNIRITRRHAMRPGVNPLVDNMKPWYFVSVNIGEMWNDIAL